jgi:hypothetical protein
MVGSPQRVLSRGAVPAQAGMPIPAGFGTADQQLMMVLNGQG